MEDKLARLMEEVETQTGWTMSIEREENTELYELLLEIIKLFY
jgi:hypothetical protein